VVLDVGSNTSPPDCKTSRLHGPITKFEYKEISAAAAVDTPSAKKGKNASYVLINTRLRRDSIIIVTVERQ